uniref:Vigilin n=1 Tax=Lygus hesperus TaxID=30085 RepID=A0A0A9XIC0_LYGHE
MGKNGATLKKINEVSGTQIQIPRNDSVVEDTTIEGLAENVEVAKTIIQEMLENGYSSTLNPSLVQRTLRVPVEKRPVILGPSGGYIKKITEVTNCKIVLPDRQSSNDMAEIIG